MINTFNLVCGESIHGPCEEDALSVGLDLFYLFLTEKAEYVEFQRYSA